MSPCSDVISLPHIRYAVLLIFVGESSCCENVHLPKCQRKTLPVQKFFTVLHGRLAPHSSSGFISTPLWNSFYPVEKWLWEEQTQPKKKTLFPARNWYPFFGTWLRCSWFLWDISVLPGSLLDRNIILPHVASIRHGSRRTKVSVSGKRFAKASID